MEGVGVLEIGGWKRRKVERNFVFLPYQNKNEMKIGIIVAMDKEMAQLRALLGKPQIQHHHNKEWVLGSIGPNEVVMQQCGIGKVNSAVGAVEMIDGYRPDIIVSTGVAGGADPAMKPLDVVVGTVYAYHDLYCGSELEYGQLPGLPARFEAGQHLIETALQSGGDTTLHSGLIVSGDWFVDAKEKMRHILELFPQAKAVDMESCSIAQVCHLYQTPFISFRIISDVPLNDHQAAQYFDFWERMANGSFRVVSQFLANLSRW